MEELKIGADIRRKEKVEKTTNFVERVEIIQEEVEIVLKRV